MSEPSLSDVFGANAVQDANQLIISKADLAAMGLTPAASNTAESLFISILLLAGQLLTEQNRFIDTQNRQIAITFAGNDLYTDQAETFLRRSWNTSVYLPYTAPSFSPDEV